MSQKDDLEDGEIADEIRVNDWDSRFSPNFNAISIDINETKGSTHSRHKTSNEKHISPIFQSSLCRTSDSLFGSSDTDLRFAANQFNDCDLRQMSAKESVRQSKRHFNTNNNAYVAQHFRKANLLNPTTDSRLSVGQQLIDANNLLPNNINNNINNNGLRLNVNPIQESHSSPFQLFRTQLEVEMRPQLRPTKALLPTPIMPFSESIQRPFQQILPPIRSRFDVQTNPQMSAQLMNSSNLLSHSNQLVAQQPQPRDWSLSPTFPYSTYLNPAMSLSSTLISNQNVPRIQSCDNISTLKKTLESFEFKNTKIFGQTLNETNNPTIVLSSDDIEEVQMVDECRSGSQSPYDPEQEVIYIPPLSPPLLMTDETKAENNFNELNIGNENSVTSSKCSLKSNECKSVGTASVPLQKRRRNSGSISSQMNRSIRSGSEERKERLKRLLTSNNINENINNINNISHLKSAKKPTKKSKDSVNEKSSKQCSIARKSGHKVHRESCKRAKNNSRRDWKKIQKRKVFTQILKPSNHRNHVRHRSRNQIQDASYEDLLEEYKRIQTQLKDLEKEEENNQIITIFESDKEGEVIEENVKSDHFIELNDDSKDEPIIDIEEDLFELRRLALESKKIKAQIPLNIDSESLEEEEIDENILREQLLKSLLKAKATSDSPKSEETHKETETESNLVEVNQQNMEIGLSDAKQAESQVTDDAIVRTNDRIPVIENLKPKLIINFGDDSSDDEQEIQKTNRKVVATTQELTSSPVPIGLDSFIKQARLRSDPKLSATHMISEPKRKSNVVVGKLSKTQQMEYQKLKAEIARREQYQVSEALLQQNQVKWKAAKAHLHEKIAKVNALKTKVALKRNALRKAQQHARKMQEAFIAATRVVSATAAEFHSLNEVLKSSESAVTTETTNVNKFEKQCIRMGLKLHGNTYKLPIGATLKRNNRDSISLSSNKKRTKSESIALSKQEIADEKKRLQELERLYSKRLQDLRNTSLLRPTSPKMIAPKLPLIVENSESNKEITLNKLKDSQMLLKTTVENFLQTPQNHPLISLNCFIELMFSDHHLEPFESSMSVPEAHFDISLTPKSQTHIDVYDSVLSHLHSYRFIDNQPKDISSDHWTNDLNPLEEICRYDLLGTCNDEKCLWQHIDKCLLDSTNKIVDLLLYDPKLAGITTQITDSIDDKVIQNIRHKLLLFAQKHINSKPQLSLETHCRHIVSQIKKRSPESVSCLLRRRIPKLFNACKTETEVPFDDLSYRFNIKYKTLVLNQAKISELRLTADPDIYFHNRFYAPEGVPISAELETTLATDPNNIQLWVKLAYYHITKCSNNSFADSIDRALNVLSRALEHNITDPELYEHYLFIYSNRVIRNGEDSRFSLINICRKVVKHCPHYRVWKCFLSLCKSFEDKAIVSTELLNNIINNSLINSNFETRSHQILEILMYKIHLHLQLNDYKLSVLQLSKALNDSQLLSELNTQSDATNCKNAVSFISDELTDSDRVFAWLCFIHLIVYKRLPAHCFELFKQGFPQLIDKNLFIFDWNALTHVINVDQIEAQIKNCLEKALQLCNSTNQNNVSFNKSSLALYINLAQLNRCQTKHSDNDINDIYQHLIKITRNDPFLWPSIVEIKYRSHENNAILIETLKESPLITNCDMKIHFIIAKHYYEMNDFMNTRNELLKIAAIHYNCDITHPLLKLAFETLLFENDENNHNFELINARKSKGSQPAFLWLSYILLLMTDSECESQIDATFESALAICSNEKASHLQLLWWNYLKFMAKNTTNQKKFHHLFESVRHCCLTISDPTFQIQVITFFCKMLSNNDKLNALIHFAKLIPENINITMNAIIFALEMNKKEMCWLLINTIIFDKKVRLQYWEFWKIAIALAIEKSDHLSVHKFFQMAVSLLPYNTVLWQTFKTYETSVKHMEHLKQAKDLCDNQIKICQNIF